MTDDRTSGTEVSPQRRARTAPSPHAMRSSYERESGKPWVDGDPFCAAFEEMWLASWTSAYTHAPAEAAALAEAVEQQYTPATVAGRRTPSPHNS